VNFRLALARSPRCVIMTSLFQCRVVSCWSQRHCPVPRVCVVLGVMGCDATREKSVTAAEEILGEILRETLGEMLERSRRADTPVHPDMTDQSRPTLKILWSNGLERWRENDERVRKSFLRSAISCDHSNS
jgi:hypothetical protein